MPAQLEIAEAKSRLDELVARARAGEEIVLSYAGTPVARLSPVAPPPGERVFGEFAGKIHLSDDFAAPLTEEGLRDWEGP